VNFIQPQTTAKQKKSQKFISPIFVQKIFIPFFQFANLQNGGLIAKLVSVRLHQEIGNALV
jgi:hypothetical protein